MKRIFNPLIIATLVVLIASPLFAQKTRTIRQKQIVREATLKSAEQMAFSDSNGVYLRWTTEAENNILGFNVYRVTKGGNELVNRNLIPGGYLRSRSADFYGDYYIFDTEGGLADTYLIERVGINGKSSFLSPVTTNYLSDLRTVAGKTSAELREETENVPSFADRTNLDLPGDLEKLVGNSQIAPDPEMQRWVAAQPGVKIFVKQKGIYRVSRTELQNAGFDVNTAGNLWQLYVNGVEQAINIGAGDSYIEFFGEGMDTVESDSRAYFLIVGNTNGKRIQPQVIRNLSGNVLSNSYLQTRVKHDRTNYLSGILNGDAENFFSSQIIGGSSTTGTTVAFDLKGVDFGTVESAIEVSLQGMVVSPHEVEVTLNGQILGTIVWNGLNMGRRTFQIPTSYLLEGANSLVLKSLAGSNDFSAFSSIKTQYGRKFEAESNQLSFFTPNYRAVKISNFSSGNVRLFDITASDNILQVSNLNVQDTGSGFTINLPSNRGRVYYAVEDTAIKTASAIVRNFPSTLSTPQHNAQMILITHRNWLTEANNWAAYRNAQGTTVEVVDVADIFDEYSYGTTNTSGMTAFFQYARDNWQTPPNYILLMGDASYDFKNYGNGAFTSFVPTKLVDTLYEETGSDEALCDFNNDGLAEIAVGRIPARSGTEVTQMLAKVTQFEGNLTNALDRGALFVSDLPIGYDFEGVNNRVSQQLPPSMPKNFIPRSNPDARNLILSDLNSGRYLVNYSGHGSTLFWAASGFYHRNDLPAMTNQNNYTIFTLLTCLNGYFVSPSLDSFAETSLKTPNGGSVVAWASSGKTTPDIQEIMATRFFNQITVGNIRSVGDLVKDAKTSLVGGRDVRLSWTLFADPAMKIR